MMPRMMMPGLHLCLGAWLFGVLGEIDANKAEVATFNVLIEIMAQPPEPNVLVHCSRCPVLLKSLCRPRPPTSKFDGVPDTTAYKLNARIPPVEKCHHFLCATCSRRALS